MSFVQDHRPVLLASALRMLPPKGQKIFEAPYLWRVLPHPRWFPSRPISLLASGLDPGNLQQNTDYEELAIYDWWPHQEPYMERLAGRQRATLEYAAEDPQRWEDHCDALVRSARPPPRPRRSDGPNMRRPKVKVAAWLADIAATQLGAAQRPARPPPGPRRSATMLTPRAARPPPRPRQAAAILPPQRRSATMLTPRANRGTKRGRDEDDTASMGFSRAKRARHDDEDSEDDEDESDEDVDDDEDEEEGDNDDEDEDDHDENEGDDDDDDDDDDDSEDDESGGSADGEVMAAVNELFATESAAGR